jgi:hypothetical protein
MFSASFAGIAGVLIIKALYPALTAAQAAEAVIPPEPAGMASGTAGRSSTGR